MILTLLLKGLILLSTAFDLTSHDSNLTFDSFDPTSHDFNLIFKDLTLVGK